MLRIYPLIGRSLTAGGSQATEIAFLEDITRVGAFGVFGTLP